MNTLPNALYDRLIAVARAESVTTYAAVAPLAGLDMGNPDHRTQIGHLLDEISSAEHHQRRPLLSVVVILEAENVPGSGFFTLARELGLYNGRTRAEDVAFFAHELARVHAHWRTA